jgi:predicted  nucleic acid-binding Zn-ribbon protein
MIMRRFMVSTVICSGLFIMGAGAQAATYKPSSDWSVKQIAAKSAQANDYCVMARQFDNDMIVTFASNPEAEGSIAIDFQKDKLNQNNSYVVTLQTASGKDRMFEVKPVSSKAMVVKLGKDKSFYSELEKSGKLKIDLSGEMMELSLSDMKSGNKELSNCVSSLSTKGGAQPASGSAIQTTGVDRIYDMTPSPALVEKPSSKPAKTKDVASKADKDKAANPADDKAAFIAQMPAGAVNTQIAILQEENMRLKNAIETERRNFENSFMKNSDNSSRSKELLEKLRLLELENNNLKSAQAKDAQGQVVTASSANSNDEFAKTLKTNLDAMAQENAKLKMDLAEQAAKISALENKTVTAALKAETSVRSEADNILSDMQKRVSSLEEENAILRTKVKMQHVDATPGDGIVLLTQLRTAEDQLSIVKDDRDRLVKEIDKIQSGRGNDLLAKVSGTPQLEEVVTRYNEAEGEVRRLGRILEQERMQCVAKVEKTEAMIFDPVVSSENQRNQIIALEEKLRSFSSGSEVEEASRQARIKSLEAQLANKEAEFDKLSVRIAEVDKSLVAKANELAESQKKIIAQEQQIASSKMNNSELQSFQGKHNELQSQYNKLQSDYAALNTKMQFVEAELSKSQLAVNQVNVKNAQIEKEKSDLATQVSKIESSNDNAAKIAREQVVLERAKFDEVSKELATLKASYDVSLKENEGLKAQIANATSQQDDVTKKVTSLVDEHKALNERIASLNEERVQLRQQLSLSNEERGQLSVKVSELEDTVKKTAEKYAAVAPASGNDVRNMNSQVSGVSAKNGIVSSAGSVVPSQNNKSIASNVSSQVSSAVSSAAVKSQLVDDKGIASILGHADIKMNGGIKTVSTNAHFVSYSWEAGSLFGTAEQSTINGLGQFSEHVQSYLQKTKERCKGDFGSVAGQEKSIAGGGKIMSYEIACVLPKGGATASVIFHAQDNVFTTFANETAMENMDQAMDKSDALMKILSNTTFAQK